jgi:hypothetical protein
LKRPIRGAAALIILLPTPSPCPRPTDPRADAASIAATVLCDDPTTGRWCAGGSGAGATLPALLDGDALAAYRAVVASVPREMLKGLPWTL